MSQDLRKQIIDAGYKAMMIKNHPDQCPTEEKPGREETCRRLAVARDWLLGICDVSDARPAPAAGEPEPMPYRVDIINRPIITNEVVDHAVESLARLIFGKRPARPRRRTNPVRQTRRDS